MCAGFINKNVDSKLMNKNSYIKCACGCGKTLFKYDKKNRKHMFLSGHNAKINHPLKGKHLSEKVRKKISLSKKGIPNPKHSATLKRLFKINKIRIWNKNLTKKIDKRVKINGEKTGNTLKRLYKEGKIKSWNTGLNKETNNSMKIISEKKKGKLNPMWNNGSSFEPYGLEFNKILKEQIRKRNNYKCQKCFKYQNELFKILNNKFINYKLHIHHIDFNKKNNNPNNLISLCNSCHMRTNYNKAYWTNYFQKRIKK